MINAKQAREQVTTNFVSTMSSEEKTIHFFIEAKVREAIERGDYKIDTKKSDFGELWDTLTKVIVKGRLLEYYDELGYRVAYDNDSTYSYFKILW